MKIKPEQLSNALANQLNALYFVFGAELLLVEESLAQIRTAAKKQGFNDRISFEISGNFDWRQISAQVSSVSLFSPKCLIECRLTTGKIGIQGSKALTEIASTLPSDVLLVICAGKLNKNQQNSKWFKTLERQGEVIQHWEMQAKYLLGWITNRMGMLGLEPNPEVAQTIAFSTEGNLLASMQEIQKLKMAYPDGKINKKAYLTQVYQQAKYTIYGLIDAALLGQVNQVLKIYQTLIDDSAMPLHLSNSLYREINAIIEMAIELQQTQIDTVLQNHQVWSTRRLMISNTLKRLPYQQLQKVLLLLGRIDRSIKGMDNLNAIDALRTLLLNLAGKSQWTQQT